MKAQPLGLGALKSSWTQLLNDFLDLLLEDEKWFCPRHIVLFISF